MHYSVHIPGRPEVDFEATLVYFACGSWVRDALHRTQRTQTEVSGRYHMRHIVLASYVGLRYRF